MFNSEGSKKSKALKLLKSFVKDMDCKYCPLCEDCDKIINGTLCDRFKNAITVLEDGGI